MYILSAWSCQWLVACHATSISDLYKLSYVLLFTHVDVMPVWPIGVLVGGLGASLLAQGCRFVGVVGRLL